MVAGGLFPIVVGQSKSSEPGNKTKLAALFLLQQSYFVLNL